MISIRETSGSRLAQQIEKGRTGDQPDLSSFNTPTLPCAVDAIIILQKEDPVQKLRRKSMNQTKGSPGVPDRLNGMKYSGIAFGPYRFVSSDLRLDT